ncbi:hypothetical protein FSP39_019255 [Pinctada imbricata]|uniref:G-protein coupled receptors family 1 profile domain-containing protein n=1 Tax=Pinctada imbricata TaxID=66713 RepID=A0AA89BV01_PINIB|nr:hypothetical protein FSP39_019255 [Pinctada imbricata]
MEVNMTMTESPLKYLMQLSASDLRYLMKWTACNTTDLDSFEDIHLAESPYHNEILEKLSISYMHVHGYLSLFVCLCGIPMNIINISVLTRKHMQTPVNCVLTWIAVSDLLTMASYIIFAMHFYCLNPPDVISAKKNSYGWMQYLLFHVNFTATTHTIAIWLGVALAIFRYNHIQSPAKGNLTRMRRLIRARITVFVIYLGSMLLLIPNYLSNEIVAKEENSTIFIMKDPKLASQSVSKIMFLNIILYGVVAKLLPCVLMIIYGSLLLRTLNSKFRTKRLQLLRKRTYLQRPMDTSRTTIMLLIVLVLFLLTELPQSILVLLSLFLKGFFENIYIPLGDTMDILALVNNGINFILYCTMSREFRKGLRKLLCSRCVRPRRERTQIDSTRPVTYSTIVDSK